MTVPDWRPSPLGDVLRKSGNRVILVSDAQYKQVTVRLWGKGLALRGVCKGAEIAAYEQVQVESGQFIISKIDARHGAFGLVPPELAGAVVSSDFPCFAIDVERVIPKFLLWFSRTERFVSLCRRASEGTTNRVRLKEAAFLASEIGLPSLNEQHGIVERLEAVSTRLKARAETAERQQAELTAMLDSAYKQICADAPRAPLGKVAPLVKRTVTIDQNESYTEFGIRSFYRGLFQRRTLSGNEFTWQSLYRIEPGDLVFSNIMAWEKAIALVDEADAHCVGNHRMLTCEPDRSRIVPGALFFYFTTRHGFAQIEAGSPGSIARNKTLSPDALQAIDVPVPSLDAQEWFEKLRTKVAALRTHQAAIVIDADTLLPSMLNQIYG